MPEPAHPKEPKPVLPIAPLHIGDDRLPGYAELHCRSNFSFLTGASHPEELVARAAELGYAAIAITDECSVAGIVRAHEEYKRQRQAAEAAMRAIQAIQAIGLPPRNARFIKLIVGSVFDVQGDGVGEGEGATPGCRLVLLARNRAGYGDLGELITLARLRCAKGEYRLTVRDLDAPPADPGHLRGLKGLPDCHALLIPRREDSAATLLAQARWLKATFAHAAIAAELLLWADDAQHIQRLDDVAAATGLPLAAAGAVLMHLRSRKPLQDTLAAIRLKTPVADCGFALARNAEQHLRPRVRLARLYRPEWLKQTLRIASDCHFCLSELEYRYPAELVPVGSTPIGHLRRLTEKGAAALYPSGVPDHVRALIEKELQLIEELKYEAFFLTVEDIVRHARSIHILCQGRGSAANSVVCYCLGITAVPPDKTAPLLFERFISRERNEPPDIDVDFEHERREEVIQYIYTKYGHERTALAAALATYRTRGAVRDVGKALDFDASQIDALARSFQWFDDDAQRMQRGLQEAGLDAEAAPVKLWVALIGQIRGFPRHLSQHVGGFVIADDKLARLVPIETAAMDQRRVIQWDKDDLESLGLLKVDILALGMLTVMRRSLDLMNRWRGLHWSMYDIPQDDPKVYDMICQADTVGVFQIESRAQQSMLPRLQPRVFYDLVIEVAIVRPGPIQGGMVHPYLKKREHKARHGSVQATPYPALDAALQRTLGIPIFQEQVMQICTIAAGFTPGEADALRRSMAAWRRTGTVKDHQQRIVEGMVERGYARDFAEAIFRQISGFGEYGFPESHAYSFAILAYFSSWLKCHEPAIFLAALLNSQPMGFYAPSQLVQDARRHGVQVRAADVLHSDWDCTLEAGGVGGAGGSRECSSSGGAGAAGQPAVRLGLRLIVSFPEAAALRLMQARSERAFADIDDLARRAALDARELQTLARADALLPLAGHRRRQLWSAAGQDRPRALLAEAPVRESAAEQPELPLAPEGEAIVLDYASTGLTLRRHPLALLRERLARRGWRSASELAQLPGGRSAWACGLVTVRQQPATANNTIFVTLEDETGSVNVIVWQHVREAHRRALLQSRLLAVAGQWQTANGVSHLIARRLVDVTPWLGRLATSSRDFH
jgi:error-prone DNA polymerase